MIVHSVMTMHIRVVAKMIHIVSRTIINKVVIEITGSPIRKFFLLVWHLLSVLLLLLPQKYCKKLERKYNDDNVWIIDPGGFDDMSSNKSDLSS